MTDFQDMNDILRERGADGLRAHMDTNGRVFRPGEPEGIAVEHSRRDNGRNRPGSVSAASLSRMTFPPIKYVVPGYIAEGCTLFAGKPKLGKSWFCLDVALAVASGGVCLGNVECEQGDVLYLALEDNLRRLQSRITRVWQMESLRGLPVPDRLHLSTEWPRANDGGLEFIREWIEDHPGARLVIVDVLAMFKATVRSKDQTLYEADYNAIKGLQALAMETGVAIIVVHHTRKGAADTDPFEKVSGTLGLSGAADTTLILDRDANGVTLYGRGRDIQEIETAVQFDKGLCRWSVLGEAADVRRTDERSEILSVLIDANEPISPRELSIACAMPRNNIDQLLYKMVKGGDVLKAGRGRYVHVDRADLIDRTTPPPDKNDKKIRNVDTNSHSDDNGQSYHLTDLIGGEAQGGDKKFETANVGVESAPAPADLIIKKNRSRSPLRRKVLAAFRQADEPLAVPTLMTMLPKNTQINVVRGIVQKLHQGGELTRVGRGLYAFNSLPARGDGDSEQ